MSRELPRSVKAHELSFVKAVAKRRRLAALIGIVAAEWSLADQILGVLFSELIHSPDFPTVEAFNNILSDRNKANIIIALANSQISDVKLRNHLKKVIRDLQNCGAKRHKYIHGKWAVHKAYPKELVLITPKLTYLEEARLYSADDFNQLIKDLRVGTIKILAIHDELVRRRQHLEAMLSNAQKIPRRKAGPKAHLSRRRQNNAGGKQ